MLAQWKNNRHRLLMAHNPGRLSWQEIATTQAGVITIRDAVAAGIPRTEIRRRLNDGRWRQPFRGVLITDLVPTAGPQHLWAVVQAIGPDAVLAGGCAAALTGLVGYDTQPVTVLVPADRRVSAPPGVLLRHSARLQITEIDPLRLPRRTTPTRSMIDMAEWPMSRALAQDLLADAVHQRIATVRGLREALSRRGPISRRTLITETLDRAAPGATTRQLPGRRAARRADLPADRALRAVAGTGRGRVDREPAGSPGRSRSGHPGPTAGAPAADRTGRRRRDRRRSPARTGLGATDGSPPPGPGLLTRRSRPAGQGLAAALAMPYFERTLRELPPEEAERAAGHKPGAADRLNLSG